MSDVKIKSALISVFSKQGIEPIVAELSKNNVKNAGKMKYQKGQTNNNTNSNWNKNKKEKEKKKKNTKDDNKSNEIKTFEWIG